MNAFALRIVDNVKACLYRRKGVMPSRPKSKRMNKGVAAKIRQLHGSQPDLSEQEIAVLVGADLGGSARR